MEKEIIQEIANQIKGLHNGALSHIKDNEFEQAAVQYRKVLIIAEKINYYEGMAMTLFSMANLSLLVGDLFEAMNNAVDAKELYIKAGKPDKDSEKLVLLLAEGLKKQGIKLEKSGKFQEAIRHYNASIPFAVEKSKIAMEHEVKLLKKIIDDRQPTTSRNFKAAK